LGLELCTVFQDGSYDLRRKNSVERFDYGMQDALTQVDAGLVDDGKFSGRPSSGVAVDIVSLPLRFSSLVPDANSSQI
jgi:hypothetical protein